MSTTEDTTRADRARSALASDIRELKEGGRQAVTRAESKLPLVIGGIVAVIAIGGVVRALQPKRRQLLPPPSSFVGKAARSAALSIVALLVRRSVTRAIDRALPEQPHRPESPATRVSV